MRPGESPFAVHDLDPALARQSVEAARELADDRLLPLPQAVEIELRASERDSAIGHLLGLSDDSGGVQKRLGGDAADVEAYASEAAMPLDQDRLQPEIGGAEGRGVAAGTGAEDHKLDVIAGAVLRRGRGRRRLAGSGWRGRARGLFSRGGAVWLEREQHTALRDAVADLDAQLFDHTRRWRGDIHRRLVGFQGDEGILGGHLVAGRDVDLDHRDVGEIADVRHADLHQRSARRRSLRTWPRYTTKRAAAAPSITLWS